jgi:hypothetical protein
MNETVGSGKIKRANAHHRGNATVFSMVDEILHRVHDWRAVPLLSRRTWVATASRLAAAFTAPTG